MKKRIRILVAICVLLAIASATVLLLYLQKEAPEKIFTKTVHDFPGHTVIQLTDAKDTNFVVLAKGVQQITATGDVNILIAADEEMLHYTFGSTDDSLRAMQPGDVFFAEANVHNPQGIAVKVADIQTNGDTVSITGAPLTMEDLLFYSDVDMDLAPSELFFDESALEQGSSVYLEPVSPVLSNTSSGPELQLDAAASVISSSTAALAPQNSSVNQNVTGWDAAPAMQLVFDSGIDVSLGKLSSTAKGKGGVSIELSGSYGTAVKNIRVQFRYSLEPVYFYAGVTCDVEEYVNASVSLEGSWRNGRSGQGITTPPFGACIPGTPIFVGGELFQLTYISGEIAGTYDQRATTQIGVTHAVSSGTTGDPQPQQLPKENRYDTEIEMNGKIEVSVGARCLIGVPFVAEVYAEGDVGARASGKTRFGRGEATSENSIHDCEKCIDGDVELFARTSAGVDLQLFSALTGYDLQLRREIAEISYKTGDFYASYRPEEPTGIKCGMGPCPFERWKTTVHVKSSIDGDAIDVTVEALHPDGTTQEKITDSKGVAVFFLPGGDNLLSCQRASRSDSCHVIIKDEPQTAKLNLREKQDVFIRYSIYRAYPYREAGLDAYPELVSRMRQMYPDAIWTAGAVSMDVLSPGDLIIEVNARREQMDAMLNGKKKNMETGFTTTSYNVSIALMTPDGSGSEHLRLHHIYHQADTLQFILVGPKHLDYEVVTGLDYTCFTSRIRSLHFDKSYRILEIDNTMVDSYLPASIPFGGQRTAYHYMANSHLYTPAFTQHATDVMFEYLELLMLRRGTAA